MLKSMLITLVTVALIISGCASNLPRQKVAVPWSRVLSSENRIPLGANIAIKVSGETVPLMGNEDLTAKYISDNAAQLLERRGFSVSGDSTQYNMTIRYKTEKETKQVTIKNNTTNYYDASPGYEPRPPRPHHGNAGHHDKDDSDLTTALGIGFGVLLAVALVSSLASDDKEEVQPSSVYEVETYRHTLGVEIFDNQKTQVWKADINWSSRDVDIIGQATSAFQIVFSSLPADEKVIPNVPLLKDSKFSDYFDSKVGRKAFHSPAVPYFVRFDASKAGSGKHYIVRNVEDKQALVAYTDLLQNAEFAVPGVNETEWKNPLERKIWKDIVLGGKYTLGENSQPVNVLITLKANSTGYIITLCRLVSDEVYKQYENRLEKWKQTLKDYYDFYD